jgi:DNA recombination protein RmuC
MPDSALVVTVVAIVGLALLLLLVVLAVLALGRLRALLEMRGALTGGLAELRTRVEVAAAQGVDFERDVKQDLALARSEQARDAQAVRAELADNLARLGQATQQQLTGMGGLQSEQLRQFAERLGQFTQATQQQLTATATAQAEQAKATSDRIAQLTQANEQRLEAVRTTVEQRLDVLRNENAKKLDEMRATVDEKLQTTLETRLGESFKLVSERLEQVHRGLGEMQGLAAGVGDLKRVLTNVKSRGTWGEVQLGALLADLLTPAQYAQNVATRPGSGERVEYAVRLPGRGDEGEPCWLPIDCKFPLEDWQRLQDAVERADAPAVEASRKALEQFFRTQAKAIRDKYVEPPHTTDFGILFVPTEGLFAEAVARPGLADSLQREFRVSLAGPTTLSAMLNSLQLGFRTLAIEQRSTEVWRVLGAIKAEFGKFGGILEKTQKKLQEASNTIDEARGKSTTIVRKLRDVEALPQDEAERMLEGAGAVIEAEAGIDAPRLPGGDLLQDGGRPDEVK